MKKEDFIGVWKLMEYGGGKIITSKTHLVVKEDILWEVHPKTIYYENESGPEVGYTFEEGQPAKLSLNSGFKYLVQKKGETLFLKLGPVYGSFPRSFQDQGNLGEYVLETAEIAQKVGVLPKKSKVEELKVRGFGTLKYDQNLRWWVGRTKFQDKKVILYISVDEDNKFEPIKRVKDKLKQLKVMAFDQIAAENLLRLFNDSWNHKEQNLTHEEFVSAITLKSIALERDEGASIWFDDGDLFAGHSINVSVDSENKVIDVGI